MHLLSMSTRSWLIVGSAALIACGALGVACSSPSYNTDGGVDSGGGGDAKSDVTTKPDGGGTDGGGGDGAVGPCTTNLVTGECDLVQQNCGTGKECVVVQADGGFVTSCQPNGTGSLPEGTVCTQNANNPCVPGLECIDGRCAKHCCLGNDSECGKSPVEGYAGRCDLTVAPNGNQSAAYAICTYSSACQPFGVQACTSDSTCLIQDSSGTAKCTQYPTADGGLPENAKCQYANDCADGLYCLTKGDAGACTWVCYVPPGPYDGGIATLGQGQGGCKTPETCHSVNWSGSLPTWLGVCQ